VNGPMTEDNPYRPVSHKGVLRAWLAERMLHAAASGRLAVSIVRAGELYGPGVRSLIAGTSSQPHCEVGLFIGSATRPSAHPNLHRRLRAGPGNRRGLRLVCGVVWHVPHPGCDDRARTGRRSVSAGRSPATPVPPRLRPHPGCWDGSRRWLVRPRKSSTSLSSHSLSTAVVVPRRSTSHPPRMRRASGQPWSLRPSACAVTLLPPASPPVAEAPRQHSPSTEMSGDRSMSRTRGRLHRVAAVTAMLALVALAPFLLRGRADGSAVGHHRPRGGVAGPVSGSAVSGSDGDRCGHWLSP
jgi:hypothetical protein